MENPAEEWGVWIVELNKRVSQLDAAQYGMLLASHTDTDGHSIRFCPHLVPLVELGVWQIWSTMFIGAVIC